MVSYCQKNIIVEGSNCARKRITSWLCKLAWQTKTAVSFWSFFHLRILHNAKKLINSWFYFLSPWLLKSELFKMCIDRPQLIQNSTECFRFRNGDDITSVLCNFHGLPIHWLIFKVLQLIFKAPNDLAHSYVFDCLSRYVLNYAYVPNY